MTWVAIVRQGKTKWADENVLLLCVKTVAVNYNDVNQFRSIIALILPAQYTVFHARRTDSRICDYGYFTVATVKLHQPYCLCTIHNVVKMVDLLHT